MNYQLQDECNSFKFTDKSLWSMYKTVKPTLNALIMHSDDDGDTFVSIDTIKKTVGCCTQTVVNHLKFLKENKIVTEVKSGKRVVRTISFNHANIITQSLQDSSNIITDSITESVLQSLQVPVTIGIEAKEGNEENGIEATQAPLRSAPHTVKKTRVKKNDEKQSWVSYINESYEDDAVSYAIDFIAYREEIKEPIKTSQAISLYMNEVINIHEKFGIATLNREIDRMKAGAWKTLYPEYKNKNKGK